MPENASNAARVDFYLLQSPCRDGRLRVACRLAETAFRHGHRVYVHAADDGMAAAFDKLLWTYTERSFVPHAVAGSLTADNPTDWPVVIGTEAPDEQHSDVLIPLLDDIPDYFARFTRVMEAVDTEDHEKKQARIRFRQYRERGTAPETHDIEA